MIAKQKKRNQEWKRERNEDAEQSEVSGRKNG